MIGSLAEEGGFFGGRLQQLLVLKQDKSVAPTLKTMTGDRTNQFARIHALWTLEGLGALDPALGALGPALGAFAPPPVFKLFGAAPGGFGAVGVTGDTEDRDEELATHGIHSAGLKTDADFAGMGRNAGVRLTNK